MALRLYLTVKNEAGDIVFDDQLLGNNECFDTQNLNVLGLKQDEEGFIDHQPVELPLLLEVWERYHAEIKFPKLANMTGKELLSEMFQTVPVYTVIGNYAIKHRALFDLVSKSEEESLSATIRFF